MIYIFPKRLKELRENNNYSQKELAEIINKTDRAIRKYETGDSQPTLPVLISLADLFDVSIDYLAGRTTSKKNN